MDLLDPNSRRPHSLDVLRRRLRTISSLEEESELRSFADALQADPRRGAQDLAQRALRRLSAISEERERVDRTQQSRNRGVPAERL